MANVRPLFKNGSWSEPRNYTPKSLTSHLGKIFEGIIKRIYS